jgi:hypothetical protein
MRRSDGAVYVLASGRHPGVVKLGRTTRAAAVRVAELTRAPGYRGFAPWHVAHVQPTADAVLVERWSHRVLRRQGRRVRLRVGCLELYRAGEAEACTVVRRIAAEVEASRAWQRRLAALSDRALASVLLAVVLLGVVLWLAR